MGARGVHRDTQTVLLLLYIDFKLKLMPILPVAGWVQFYNSFDRTLGQDNCSSKMHVDPSNFEPEHELQDINGKPVRLREHWKDLSYVIGPQEMEGLLLFLNLVRELNQQHLNSGILLKLSRLQHWHADLHN